MNKIKMAAFVDEIQKIASADDVRARMEMVDAQSSGRNIGAAIGLGIGLGTGLAIKRGNLRLIEGLLGSVGGGVAGGVLGNILAGRKHQKLYDNKPIPAFVHKERALQEEQNKIEAVEQAELRRKQFIASTGGTIGGLAGRALNRKFGNEDEKWKATVAGHGVGAIAANALRRKLENRGEK